MTDKILAFHRSPSIAPGAEETHESDSGQPGLPLSFHEVLHGKYIEGDPASLLTQVSVVVPTCGRAQLLKQCFNSLLSQEFEPSSYEIVIVDDRPHPATRAALLECIRQREQGGAELPHILYIASPGPHGPAAARNFGWRASRSPLIAFTDDDTVASPSWLRNGLRALGPDVKAVWGRIEMPLEGTPTDYERDAKGLESAEFVTANCFCPKRVLEQLGGFDERFEFAWREDADLYFRLLGLGGRVVHAPEALIVHPIRPAAWGVSMRQQKKIQSDALLYKKHPDLYRQKIRARPRWDYYLIVACLVVCVAALLAGHAVLAAAAGAIWLLLSGRFCAMRLSGTAKTPSHILEMLATSAVIPPLAVYWRMVGAVKFRVALI